MTLHRVAGEDRLSPGRDDLIGRRSRHLRPLDGTPIDDCGLVNSSSATGLEALYLRNLKATYAGPAHLDRLPRLHGIAGERLPLSPGRA